MSELHGAQIGIIKAGKCHDHTAGTHHGTDLGQVHEVDEKLLQYADTESPSPLKKLRLWHTVLEFFMDILPEQTEMIPANDDYRRLLPVLEKLGNKMLSLEEGAKLCNLSVSRFSVLFKNFSGLSFGRYERNFRLNGAAGTIRRGATLKEAAEKWDFCDKSHLARLLKEL